MLASEKGRTSGLAIVSLVLAVLGGLWSAIGAFYPGTIVGAVAAVMAYVARQRASQGNNAMATAALAVALMVITGGVALALIDAG